MTQVNTFIWPHGRWHSLEDQHCVTIKLSGMEPFYLVMNLMRDLRKLIRLTNDCN